MSKAKKSHTEHAKEAIRDSLIDFLREVYHELKSDIPPIVQRFKAQVKIRLLEAQKKFVGETMVILGPPAAGKTTLLQVLRNPEVSGKDLKTYRKTEVDGVDAFRCSWKLTVIDDEQIHFNFKVRKTTDVGGESYVRENHWAQAIKDAKIIIYVLDTKQFIEDSDGYKKRIKDDFDWLLVNSQKPKVNFSLLLVANKADLFCDRSTYAKFEESQKKAFDAFADELRALWKPGLRSNIKGITLLSLTDDILRHITLDNLILGLVGDDLRSLYLKAKAVPESQ